MAYLLRKLRDKNAWANVMESPLWAPEDCPPEALWQVFDNRQSVSVWRVEGHEQIKRVIAAQAFLGKSIPNDFAYFLIDEHVLRDAGILLEDKPNPTFDREISQLHVNIVQITGKHLIKFAQLLNTQAESRVMTRSEILETAAIHFNNGLFDRAFLFEAKGNKGRSEEEIASSKALLVSLWKKGAIDIALKKEQ
jgi:hypothetical protein